MSPDKGRSSLSAKDIQDVHVQMKRIPHNEKIPLYKAIQAY